MHPAYSVIFFTTASGAGYGLLALAALHGAVVGAPLDPWFGAAALGLGAALVTGGLLSSTLHLGRPERAWRAYSQWRTSWLSREGVLATAAYAPMALTAWAWTARGAVEGGMALAAVALALLCALTVHATGMIYATLRTVPAWHSRLTVPGYLVFAWLTGALWFHALAQMFGVRSPGIALLVIVPLFLAWYVKRAYWRSLDSAPGPVTAASAVGLDADRAVRPLDPPNTGRGFVQREMGYRVARRHARRLRRLSFTGWFLVPALLTAATTQADPWIAVPGTLIAALSASGGALVERWLFFAEATHVSSLYYGGAGRA